MLGARALWLGYDFAFAVDLQIRQGPCGGSIHPVLRRADSCRHAHSPSADADGQAPLSIQNVSTRTISESSSATILTFSSSAIAAPSRASMRTPFTSIAPVAGTR